MKKLIIFVVLISTPAIAQQPGVDAAFLQRALISVENQRNQALTAQVVAEAKAGLLADELAKANARIKEMEKPAEKPPEGEKPKE